MSFDKGREKALQEITNKASKVGVRLGNIKRTLRVSTPAGQFVIYIENPRADYYEFFITHGDQHGPTIKRSGGYRTKEQALQVAQDFIYKIRRDVKGIILP